MPRAHLVALALIALPGLTGCPPPPEDAPPAAHLRLLDPALRDPERYFGTPMGVGLTAEVQVHCPGAETCEVLEAYVDPPELADVRWLDDRIMLEGLRPGRAMLEVITTGGDGRVEVRFAEVDHQRLRGVPLADAPLPESPSPAGPVKALEGGIERFTVTHHRADGGAIAGLGHDPDDPSPAEVAERLESAPHTYALRYLVAGDHRVTIGASIVDRVVVPPSEVRTLYAYGFVQRVVVGETWVVEATARDGIGATLVALDGAARVTALAPDVCEVEAEAPPGVRRTALQRTVRALSPGLCEVEVAVGSQSQLLRFTVDP